MTTTRWQFTGLEFSILWEAIGRDRLPYPLRFRPAAETMDELREERRRAGAHLSAVIDDRLHHVLGALANPDARVEVSGFHGTNMSTLTRLHGVVAGDLGVLAAQLPGRTSDCGSDVVLSMAHPSAIPRMLVARLPACSAGSERGVSIERSKPAGEQSFLNSAGSSRGSEEVSRFFGRERTSIGEVTAYPGGAVDSRPTDDGITFHWYDYAGDGRYIVTAGETISARSASAELTEAEIARNLGLVGYQATG
ncbi:ESX secretion-associated protein EspG [Rhodococcus erythropolis]|uniref:ESX secretion-associated protein EspG n=1 Tax=Rhodococcus erythropolis TaxID=1833 RepID=UPI001BED1F49|nr:ESX secretion-associated protein EspG [Rhodococcus erythropolis]MBT2264985.1 ESX secretion-associated protein EspG [Rhodococcus erythropolis]